MENISNKSIQLTDLMKFINNQMLILDAEIAVHKNTNDLESMTQNRLEKAYTIGKLAMLNEFSRDILDNLSKKSST